MLLAGLQTAAAAQTGLRPLSVPALDHGYWIINARDSQGRLGRSQAHSFHVWRFEGDGQGRCASLEEFYGSLTPSAPVCFMAHGSFVTWDDVREDSRLTNQWLRSPAPQAPLHVVFFHWPSDDTPMLLLPVDVTILGRRAGRYGFYVAEMISQIPEEHPISLIGHSHGARMVVATLHVLGGGEIDDVAFGGGPYHRHRIRAVLAAAAFDHDWLNPGELYDRAIQRPEAILNLVNRRDRALGFYPLHRPLTLAAAARSGFTAGDRQSIGPQNRKLVDYDVTERVGTGHVWPTYYTNAGIAQSISPYVFFHDQPVIATARGSSHVLANHPARRMESHRASKWELTPVVDQR